VLGSAFVVRYFTGLPPFTITTADVKLDFVGNDVKVAVLSKSYRIRPNYGHLNTMTHKNIAADGSVRNLCWDDKPIPAVDIKELLGEYVVTIRFPYALRKWREIAGKLSYEVCDSFNGNPEALIYVVDFPTKTVCIEVNFPLNRLCLDAEAFKLEGTAQHPIRNPMISADRRNLKLLLKRPRVGSEFMIYWRW
jgi:hypothetical protein